MDTWRNSASPLHPSLERLRGPKVAPLRLTDVLVLGTRRHGSSFHSSTIQLLGPFSPLFDQIKQSKKDEASFLFPHQAPLWHGNAAVTAIGVLFPRSSSSVLLLLVPHSPPSLQPTPPHPPTHHPTKKPPSSIFLFPTLLVQTHRPLPTGIDLNFSEKKNYFSAKKRATRIDLPFRSRPTQCKPEIFIQRNTSSSCKRKTTKTEMASFERESFTRDGEGGTRAAGGKLLIGGGLEAGGMQPVGSFSIFLKKKTTKSLLWRVAVIWAAHWKHSWAGTLLESLTIVRKSLSDREAGARGGWHTSRRIWKKRCMRSRVSNSNQYWRVQEALWRHMCWLRIRGARGALAHLVSTLCLPSDRPLNACNQNA